MKPGARVAMVNTKLTEPGDQKMHIRNAVDQYLTRIDGNTPIFTDDRSAAMVIAPADVDSLLAKKWSAIHRAPPGPDRWKFRSKTFPGIAAAMAEQWGDFLVDYFQGAAA